MPRKTNKTRKKTRLTKSVTRQVRKAARSVSGATKRVTRRAKRAVTASRRHQAPVARAGQGDAVALLKADHKQLRHLLEQLKEAQGASGRREKLLAQVEEILKTHTTIEEEIFYPAFRDVAVTKRDRQLFHEALEEHHAVDTILPEVAGAKAEPDVFAARAKVLKEIVEHHAEEEESDMFPRARQLLPAAELRRLGAEMAARKRSLQRPATGALRAVTSLFSS
jgi:hemerythrin superfamily protein